MSHMVIFRGADGKPGYHQTDDIHDAVMYVESLRNDKSVDHARIFRMEEVTFEYKPYFRVELNAGSGAALGSSASSTEQLSSSNDNGDDVLETTESDDSDDDTDDSDVEDATSEDSGADDDNSANGDSDDDVASDDSDADDAPVSRVRSGLFGR